MVETESERAERRRAERPRRTYVRPRIESGEAFERVQLASGCDSGSPEEGCENPCG